MATSIFLDPEIETLVVSAGGVGTTFLLDAIGQYRRVNDRNNADGYKHLTLPPLGGRPELKAIYVYGDPIMATVSLFRRKYHATQSIVAQRFYPSVGELALNSSLDAYVGRGKDHLFFERHFNAWNERPTTFPVLFLAYEAIHDELDTIAAFLDLPSEFVDNFPPRRARKSDFEQLEAATRTGLIKMYGQWSLEQEAFPASWVKPAKQQLLPPLDDLYFRAYGDHLRRKYKWLRRLFV